MTQIKHQLIHIFGGDHLPSWEEIFWLRAKLIDQQQAVIDILVKLSDQFELQENMQSKELICEKIETINKEFEAVMTEANWYISEPKGDT